MPAALRQCVQHFVRDESGPTAVEYAVMLALIITVCFGAVATVGNNTSKSFSTAGQKWAPSSSS